MHTRITWPLALILIALWQPSVARGDDPSLGDIARQQKKQLAGKGQQAKKVITDEDIPERSQASNDLENEKDVPEVRPKPGDNAERVKAVIRVQKQRIQALKSQIEKLSASIHYVEANRYSNGVQYNELQQRKQQEVQRMQAQLSQEQAKLGDMQEAARRAGFGSVVYDP